jgi:protein TonB
MRHKQGKHFSITLLVSFTLHLFVLTLLFNIPKNESGEEYRKVKVRLLTGSKAQVRNRVIAEQYASFSPSAGTKEQATIYDNLVQSASALPEIPIPPIPKQIALEEPGSEAAKAPEENANKMIKGLAPAAAEKANQGLEKQAASAKHSGKNAPARPQIKEEEGGTLIGNSSDVDSEKLASYEQMLPLWLDKFKQSPTNASGIKIQGSGEVFIKIDRKGKVLLAKVIKSTGYIELDKALMKMIEDANPVLPVPDDYYAEKKTFSYKIAFEFKG